MMANIRREAESVAPLAARGLSKRYGAQQVLLDVSLSVAPGTLLGLVGRNGAGKSTLLECLLGLRAPDAGEVRLLGLPAARLDDAAKRRLGYVPQRPDGLDWMTVGAMLDAVGALYGGVWDGALVERLLAAWGLDRRRRLAVLSPGQRQQLAILRALAPRPALLVLDEPASALDPLARRALLREIVDLSADTGTAVVFSTHIVSDLERVASHIALLHGGRLRLNDRLDNLKDELRRLVWPAGQPLPACLPGELSRRPLQEGGWSLVLRQAPAAAAPAPEPAALRGQPLGLEDLFVELTA